jgi:hypothetical protein
MIRIGANGDAEIEALQFSERRLASGYSRRFQYSDDDSFAIEQ